MLISPGLCDESIKLCVVEVDLDAPENRAPRQELDEAEYIHVRRVPIGQLLPSLREMERQGLVPFTGLYTLAMGLSLGAQMGANAA